jgi:NTE family protein
VVRASHVAPPLILCLLGGCASIYPPDNKPITRVDNDSGYYAASIDRRAQGIGDHLVVLSFSGGGTRAAALSYGVLEELRDTQVDSAEGRMRLLDAVDSISSVSGGSFTAAYYGLFGDDIFKDYEKTFLRQNIQSSLIRKLFNPVYWWKSIFTGFDRTEMAIEYYDQQLFHGKTFADIPLGKRPFIEINATDLANGSRFSFTQGTFDVICSDLESYSVSRAVTASSAVPIAFRTVVLKNHAGECGFDVGKRLENSAADPQFAESLRNRVTALQDTKTNAYLHLVDGGISDNLGLRSLLDRVNYMGGIVKSLNVLGHPPKDVLVLLVNAAVSPARPFTEKPNKPSIRETMSALSSAQLELYSKDTLDLIKTRLTQYESEMTVAGHPMPFYFVEVSFRSITTPHLQEFFNNLPTSFELSKEQVDSLIRGGRELVRTNPEFMAFLKANHGALAAVGGTCDSQKNGCDSAAASNDGAAPARQVQALAP